MKTVKKLLISQEDDENTIIKKVEELEKYNIDCEFYVFPRKFWSMATYTTFSLKLNPSISHNDSRAVLYGKNVFIISPIKL